MRPVQWCVVRAASYTSSGRHELERPRCHDEQTWRRSPILPLYSISIAISNPSRSFRWPFPSKSACAQQTHILLISLIGNAASFRNAQLAWRPRVQLYCATWHHSSHTHAPNWVHPVEAMADDGDRVLSIAHYSPLQPSDGDEPQGYQSGGPAAAVHVNAWRKKGSKEMLDENNTGVQPKPSRPPAPPIVSYNAAQDEPKMRHEQQRAYRAKTPTTCCTGCACRGGLNLCVALVVVFIGACSTAALLSISTPSVTANDCLDASRYALLVLLGLARLLSAVRDHIKQRALPPTIDMPETYRAAKAWAVVFELLMGALEAWGYFLIMLRGLAFTVELLPALLHVVCVGSVDTCLRFLLCAVSALCGSKQPPEWFRLLQLFFGAAGLATALGVVAYDAHEPWYIILLGYTLARASHIASLVREWMIPSAHSDGGHHKQSLPPRLRNPVPKAFNTWRAVRDVFARGSCTVALAAGYTLISLLLAWFHYDRGHLSRCMGETGDIVGAVALCLAVLVFGGMSAEVQRYLFNGGASCVLMIVYLLHVAAAFVVCVRFPDFINWLAGRWFHVSGLRRCHGAATTPQAACPDSRR